MMIAENLLDKTLDALDRGDEDTAHRMAAKAAARPFDEYEELWPGPWAAHYRLFEEVVDTIEEWPEGDHGWVDVLAEVTAQATGRHLTELRSLAATLAQDARFHAVEPAEAARLHELAEGAQVTEVDNDLPEADRAAYVLDLARLIRVVSERLAEASNVWEV